jgi:hypothetical protein
MTLLEWNFKFGVASSYPIGLWHSVREEKSTICGKTLEDNLAEAEVLLSATSRAIAL